MLLTVSKGEVFSSCHSSLSWYPLDPVPHSLFLFSFPPTDKKERRDAVSIITVAQFLPFWQQRPPGVLAVMGAHILNLGSATQLKPLRLLFG